MLNRLHILVCAGSPHNQIPDRHGQDDAECAQASLPAASLPGRAGIVLLCCVMLADTDVCVQVALHPYPRCVLREANDYTLLCCVALCRVVDCVVLLTLQMLRTFSDHSVVCTLLVCVVDTLQMLRTLSDQSLVMSEVPLKSFAAVRAPTRPVLPYQISTLAVHYPPLLYNIHPCCTLAVWGELTTDSGVRVCVCVYVGGGDGVWGTAGYTTHTTIPDITHACARTVRHLHVT